MFSQKFVLLCYKVKDDGVTVNYTPTNAIQPSFMVSFEIYHLNSEPVYEVYELLPCLELDFR